MKTHYLLLALLILSLTTLAKESSIPLLAVKEGPEGLEGGSVANLHLEIKPGKGNVYFDTYPLTKFDTQVTTRYAKEIACYYTNVNCNTLDFFYTIASESSIVGGPSAGSAAAALTSALLMGWDIKPGVAITGTINSGGLIGPVGGLHEKIDAAATLGLHTVVIPEGSQLEKGNTTKRTANLGEYGKEKGITVLTATNLFDVTYALTGKHLPQTTANITINPDYQEVMRSLAQDLCSRSAELKKKSISITNASTDSEHYIAYAYNLTHQGEQAFNSSLYYASASYCFGANVRLAYAAIKEQNPTVTDIKNKLISLQKKINESNAVIDSTPIKTITDLQSYMVVNERLEEAQELYETAYLESYNATTNTLDAAMVDLAYAIERLYSASSWATFFGTPGRQFQLTPSDLRISCSEKIGEAQERIQYVKLFLPLGLENTDQLLAQASDNMQRNDYALCLYHASKAKAEANVILSTIGYDKNDLPKVVNNKIAAARDIILREQQRGVFPILGYSFYEYAISLAPENPLSALLYSEYALELSSMNIYFREKSHAWSIQLTTSTIAYLLIGLGIGIVIGMYFSRRSPLESSQNLHSKPQKGKKSTTRSALIPPPPDDLEENETHL